MNLRKIWEQLHLAKHHQATNHAHEIQPTLNKRTNTTFSDFVLNFDIIRTSISCFNLIAMFVSYRNLPKRTLVVNQFHATGFFLYPLKTSGNFWFSHVFSEYRRRTVTWNGLISQLGRWTFYWTSAGCLIFRKDYSVVIMLLDCFSKVVVK